MFLKDFTNQLITIYSFFQSLRGPDPWIDIFILHQNKQLRAQIFVMNSKLSILYALILHLFPPISLVFHWFLGRSLHRENVNANHFYSKLSNNTFSFHDNEGNPPFCRYTISYYLLHSGNSSLIDSLIIFLAFDLPYLIKLKW